MRLTKTDKQASADRPATRAGQRVFSIFISPDDWRELRLYGFETGRTMQSLGAEAIADLLKKLGRRAK